MNVYSTPCPISSPSLNAEFDSNFQVSSTPNKLLYNYLNNNHEYGCENVWSILTNEISYTIDKNLYTNCEYKPTQLDGADYTNISLYNPDNSNEPCNVSKILSPHYQTQNNNTSMLTITTYHLKMIGILTCQLYWQRNSDLT